MERLAGPWVRRLYSGGPSLQLSSSISAPSPVSRKSVEFPSYGSGSVMNQALQAEVDKILEKCALDLVDHPGVGYYSHLFLVQKVIGEWRPVIDLLAHNHYMTVTPFRMEMVALVLGSFRM